MVDQELKVVLWSAPAQELWGLTAEEVHGQPLAALDMGLPTEPLLAPLLQCMEGGPKVEMIVDATNRRGHAIECYVTCSALVDDQKSRGALLLMRDVQFQERKFKDRERDATSSGGSRSRD